MADEHVGKFQGFRNSKLIIVKRTSSFARESIKASLFSCVVETFSFSADYEAPSGFSDWREAFSLSVCIGLFPDRPLFGRDAQDTDTKKIDRQAIAERETCIGFHTKVRFIDFFTEQLPIYPKRFYRLRGADLPSLCPQAV